MCVRSWHQLSNQELVELPLSPILDPIHFKETSKRGSCSLWKRQMLSSFPQWSYYCTVTARQNYTTSNPYLHGRSLLWSNCAFGSNFCLQTSGDMGLNMLKKDSPPSTTKIERQTKRTEYGFRLMLAQFEN